VAAPRAQYLIPVDEFAEVEVPALRSFTRKSSARYVTGTRRRLRS